MKYYIIAGEASGDLHASNLMRELRKKDANAEFRCWGGDLMEAQGAVLVKHYRELAFMGFTEVAMNLRTILRNIEICKTDILSWKPDVVICVDYPGFNLRIAEFVKEKGFRVFYYISPAIWAWKQSRIHKIKRSVDRMFTILPFEKEFYKKLGFDVDFVGHPLLDALENYRENTLQIETRKPVIALLPGSRRQEISRMLPVMLETLQHFPEFHFVIAGAPSMPQEFYDSLIGDSKVQIVYGQTYNLLRCSHAALVTSGTATLETALFRVPEVVCYKAGSVSYQIARRLVKVKYISLVNLILDKPVVTELVQNDFNVSRLSDELRRITKDEAVRNQMLASYDELKTKLGGAGASSRLADLMLGYLQLKHA
jgi:lipid-A-disaccharide synthase